MLGDDIAKAEWPASRSTIMENIWRKTFDDTRVGPWARVRQNRSNKRLTSGSGKPGLAVIFTFLQSSGNRMAFGYV